MNIFLAAYILAGLVWAAFFWDFYNRDEWREYRARNIDVTPEEKPWLIRAYFWVMVLMSVINVCAWPIMIVLCSKEIRRSRSWK